jgi:hypothetical protein
MTIIGLFLAALPALFAASPLNISHRVLFGLPYTLAWISLMFAVQTNFPENEWFVHLKTPHLISCGLFGALLTAVISDHFLKTLDRSLQKDIPYRTLKYVVASGVPILIGFTYLSIRNLDLISWQWLLTSGTLSLGAGLYFKYFEEDFRKDAKAQREI